MQSSDKITIEYDVPAIMRDGTTILRANIYQQAGEGISGYAFSLMTKESNANYDNQKRLYHGSQ